jgi:tRNA nucleotidyltransferase (CCA-adding enzyme)
MAVSSEGDLVDPFYGMDDLNRRVIRCVGDPDIRFNEDALRMYRALRFSARYDFSIDELTKISIRKNAASAQYLAAERIRDELQKILQSDHTDRLNEIAEMHLLDRFCTTTKSIPDFTDLSKLKKHAHIRWAGFCHLLKHAGWIQSASQFLHALRMDNRTIKICSTCSLLLDTNPPDGRISWKKALSKYGTDSVECAAMITDWLQGTKYQKEVSSILRSGECFSLKFLAIVGKDLMEHGYSGPVLGEMLQFLLDYVIEHPENNKRELLIQLAGDHEET